MSELERDKPDASADPTEEFDRVADELDPNLRVVDVRRLRVWILAFLFVLVLYATADTWFGDVVTWIIAVLIVGALLIGFFFWLADRVLDDVAPRR